jgi:hypothetical protein
MEVQRKHRNVLVLVFYLVSSEGDYNSHTHTPLTRFPLLGMPDDTNNPVPEMCFIKTKMMNNVQKIKN